MVVSRSITKAEYRAIASMVEETKAVQALSMELEVEVSLLMNILSDDQGATFTANSLLWHSKMMQVTMDFHFVRDNAEQGIIGVKHILGTKQLANIMTKSKAFQELNIKLIDQC